MKKERPQFNQVNVARKGMELDLLFFYKFIVCYLPRDGVIPVK